METLRTLALLFPENGMNLTANITRLLHMHTSDEYIRHVGHVLPGYRRIQAYKYWRDRLVDLKETFDQAQPTTLRQMLQDRRDAPAWAAFLIAMVILVLTAGQFVVGILQLYKTDQPTQPEKC